jgi:hypothetical protein
MADGGGSPAMSSSQQSAPAYLQPYLNYGLQQGTALYQSPSPSYYAGSQVAAPSTATQAGWQDAIARATQGSRVGNAAQQYGTNVLHGAYLGDSPYQRAVDQSITAATVPTVASQFSLGGRYGSGAHQGTMETALANAIAPQHYQNYQNERANMQNMAGMAPQLGQMDWQDIQGLMGAGAQQDVLGQNQINANMQKWNYNQNLAQNKLQQYMQMLGSPAFGTSSTSTQAPATSGTGSQILGILGGLGSAALLSDRTLKKNIAPLEDALAKVEALQGVSFDWIGSANGHREIGFVAQEVEEIVPEVVWDIPLAEGETKLGIDYPKLTALLVEAVKTLSAKVAALEATQRPVGTF